MVQPRPIVTPGRTATCAPSQQSSPIRIAFAKEPWLLFDRSAESTSCASVQMQTSGPISVRSLTETGAESKIDTLRNYQHCPPHWRIDEPKVIEVRHSLSIHVHINANKCVTPPCAEKGRLDIGASPQLAKYQFCNCHPSTFQGLEGTTVWQGVIVKGFKVLSYFKLTVEHDLRVAGFKTWTDKH